jgi:phage tail-like protein
MPSRPTDHFFNGRFAIEIEGVEAGRFLQCDGLQARIDVIEYSDGNDLRRHKLPGRPAVCNLVLRRGVTDSDTLWKWFKSAYDGQLTRRAGSIIVLDEAAQELYRFNFYEGWPCRWKSLELATDKPGSLIEEIEIAIEHFERG